MNQTNQENSHNAAHALSNVRKMERAGRRRAITPIWVGAALAILTGLIFGLAGMGVSRLITAPFFVLMVLIVLFQTYKMGVLVRPFSSRHTSVVAMMVTAMISIPVILLSQNLYSEMGAAAPIIIGAIIALVGIILFVLERRVNCNYIESLK